MDLKKLSKLMRFPRVAWHYKRGSQQLPYGPLRLWVEPTSFCNLKCPMCTSKYLPEEKIGYMDWNLYKKIIDEAKDSVYDINLFMGGESLFHKHLPEMIEYAKAEGIGTRLSTNATMLTREKRDALFDAGLDFIIFSFDGYEKEVYENIRVNANFEKTLGNIKGFLEEKKRRGSSKPYVVFQVIEFTNNPPPFNPLPPGEGKLKRALIISPPLMGGGEGEGEKGKGEKGEGDKKGFSNETHTSLRLTKEDENNPLLPVAMLRSNGNPAPLEKGGKGGFERPFSGEENEGRKKAFLKEFEGLPVDKFSVISPHTFGGKIRREEGKGFRTMGRRYAPCTFLWYSMSIRWDGMVVPCCVDLAGEMPVGNLHRESLIEVWNGPVLAYMRRKIAAGQYRDLTLCSGCDILWKEQMFGIPVKSIKELRYFLTGAR